MNRVIYLIMCFSIAMGLLGCTTESADTSQQEVASISGKAEVKPIVSDESEEVNQENTEEEATDSSIDLDLTALSSTLIYSEVFNMMMTPSDYEGKSVKMKGICNMYQEPETGKKYYACIVQDATQCCSQGLEFVLDENQYGESDYPAVGEDIVIQGTFATYVEDGNQYLTMLDSVLVN